MTLVYMFPGQGSQSKGMGGKELFAKFSSLTDKANNILGYSIEELCLNDPDNLLNKTQYTQPALYTVNVLMYLQLIESQPKPNIVMGHSLGEYNALFAANAFDFETGLKIVKKRAELMSEVLNGAMAAIIGLNYEQVWEKLDAAKLSLIDIANINSPSQVVISGPKDELDKAKTFFEKESGVRYFPLNVSGAFHSRYMKDKAMLFADFLKSYQFAKMTIPVISNYTAIPYEADKIAETLSNQIFNSVKWLQCMKYCLGLPDCQFQEVGPGKVLAGLQKNILKG